MNEGVLPRRIEIGAIFVAMLLVDCFPAALHAQEGSSEIPDLSAIWQRSGRHTMPSELSLNARGIAMREAFDQFQHPMYDCGPASTPQILGDPYNLQIEQRTDRVIISFEKDEVTRTVWLEGHGHRAATANDFSVQGYSTGRYENGDLVVETTRFTFDPAGLSARGTGMVPSSTSKRTVERYSRDGDQLTVEVAVHDQLFLTEPMQFRFQFASTDTPLVDWLPCDPAHARNPLRYIPDEELKYGVR